MGGVHRVGRASTTVEFGYIIHGIYHPAAYIGHLWSGPGVDDITEFYCTLIGPTYWFLCFHSISFLGPTKTERNAARGRLDHPVGVSAGQ